MDTGSTNCSIPISLLPANGKALLDECHTSIEGVSGVTKPVGQFVCKLQFGKHFFKDILVYVLDTDAPPLIGRSVWKHDSVKKTLIDDVNITFSRRIKDFKFDHVLKLTQPNESYHGSNIVTAPTSNTSTLAKVEWLRTHKSVILQKQNCTDAQFDDMVNLLLKYKDVFGTDDSPLGKFPEPVKIPTTGEARYIKQHSIPQQFEGTIDKEIEMMLTKGVIEICDDPKGFNTPVFVVPKKDGSARVVANYKHSLNRVLSSSCDMAWQMPSTDESIGRIGRGNKYFSSLDLKSGYWQCEIEKSDRYKTAFQWGSICYQYTRLPFGLMCSGQIFSRCIAKALNEVDNQNNFEVYIDDVLCYGKTFNPYLKTLEQILASAQKYGIKMNAKKCTFLDTSAKFLGRVITSNGYEADKENVKSILEMQPPTSRRELQVAIGRILWLRHFVETRIGERVKTNNFSHLVAEMNKLNRRNKTFEWSDAADKAFKKVKQRLSSPPVIHFADFKLPFTLITDASEVAVGAVLMQKHNGHEVPVAVASQTLNDVEQRWSPTEREAYAVVWAVGRFDYYLRGRPFVIYTDHKSLTFIDRTNFNNAKISRWQDKLSAYSFVVQYIEGESNVFADLLSRPHGVKKAPKPNSSEVAGKFYNIGKSKLRVYVPSWAANDIKQLELVSTPEAVQNAHCFTADCVNDVQIKPELTSKLDMLEMQMNDLFLSRVIEVLENQRAGWKTNLQMEMDESDHRGILYKRYANRFSLDPFTKVLKIDVKGQLKTVIPQSVYPHVLYRAHDLNGHFGRERVSEALRDCWWPGKQDDIINYINSCVKCSMVKGNYNRSAKPDTGHVLRGTKPFEVIYIDFIHMPQSGRGHKYVLTVLDSFTRYLIAVPTHRDRAIDTARSLVNEVFLKRNVTPKIISSDRGTHFTGSVMNELCTLLGVQQNFHCSWHPESSGNIERCHRTLKNALYATRAERNCDWIEVLQFCVHAMNTSKNKATGIAPSFAISGQKPDIGLPRSSGNDVTSTTAISYGLNVKAVLNHVHYLVELSADCADKTMEERVNKKGTVQSILIGDKVFLKRERSAFAKRTKLKWTGPYVVKDTNQHVVKVTDETGNSDWVHRHHILKKVDRDPKLEHSSNVIPLILDLDDEKLEPQRVSKLPSVNPTRKSGGLGRELSKSKGKPNVTKSKVKTTQPPAVVQTPRRSSRTRPPRELLQIEHGQKSYGGQASCL